MVDENENNKDILQTEIATDLALEAKEEEIEKLECLNCSAPLQGPYCHNCGQPDRNFIRFFPKVLWDMINEAFDFDSKIFRTLLPLLLFPGRLSMEYIAGRRARYVNPLRLYIVLSVVFFISISLFTDPKSNIHIGDHESGNVPTDPVELAELITDQKMALATLKSKQLEGLPITDEAITEIEQSIADLENPPKKEDKESKGLDKKNGSFDITLDNGEQWDVKANPILFNGIFSEETTTELNLFLMNLVEKLDKVIREDSSELVAEFLNAIPQLMFLLLPIFALLLKFTYIFKKRYYMEHLIVALHSHCFIFFSLLLIILLNAIATSFAETIWLKETIELMVIALAIWIPINIYLTQKKIYAQGYFMTTVKYIFVGVAYWMLLTATAALAFVVGLVNL